MKKADLTEKLKQDDLPLDEKLALIDKLMNDKEFQADFNKANGRPIDTPIDPMDALQCEGCQ